MLCIIPAVAFARLFFPAEAKVAMQIAQADTTEEFGGIAAPSTSGKLREVDLNETPAIQSKRLRSRVDALMKTGEVSIINFSILMNSPCTSAPITKKFSSNATICSSDSEFGSSCVKQHHT